MEAVVAGVKDSMMGGPIAGAPLVDVDVTLDLVETFDKDSNSQALRIAAAQAVRTAIRNGGGSKMQPLMKIEVVVPGEYVGSVLGDLSIQTSCNLRSGFPAWTPFLYWVNARWNRCLGTLPHSVP